MSIHIGVVAETNSFHTEKWTQALLDAGVRVTVFSLSPVQIPHVPCVHIRPRFTWRGKLTYFSYLGTADRLRKALLAHQVDIVNPINVTPHGAWARRAGVSPMITVAMGADILEYPPNRAQRVASARSWESSYTQGSWWHDWLYRMKWPIFRHEVQRALTASDLITGDNLQLVEAVQQWFGIAPEKTYLHRWGIDEGLFVPDVERQKQIRDRFCISPEQRVVLSARGLKPIYQGDIVLDAIERLLREGIENVIFIVLGTYDVPLALDQQAEKLMQEFPQMHYQRTRIARAEVAQLWQLTDVFVNVPVYDGFSNALCEGRYVGAIPILNDIPAHREVAVPDKHAYYADPLTAERLAAVIRQALSEKPERKSSMAEENRTWIAQHAMLANNMQAFLTHCERFTGK